VTVHIYRLVDPRDGSTKYIGQTVNMAQRLQGHLNQSCFNNIKKGAWIAELRAAGLSPLMEEICQCSDKDANAVERIHIEAARQAGEILNSKLGRPTVEVKNVPVSIGMPLLALDRLAELAKSRHMSRSALISEALRASYPSAFEGIG